MSQPEEAKPKSKIDWGRLLESAAIGFGTASGNQSLIDQILSSRVRRNNYNERMEKQEYDRQMQVEAIAEDLRRRNQDLSTTERHRTEDLDRGRVNQVIQNRNVGDLSPETVSTLGSPEDLLTAAQPRGPQAKSDEALGVAQSESGRGRVKLDQADKDAALEGSLKLNEASRGRQKKAGTLFSPPSNYGGMGPGEKAFETTDNRNAANAGKVTSGVNKQELYKELESLAANIGGLVGYESDAYLGVYEKLIEFEQVDPASKGAANAYNRLVREARRVNGRVSMRGDGKESGGLVTDDDDG